MIYIVFASLAIVVYGMMTTNPLFWFVSPLGIASCIYGLIISIRPLKPILSFRKQLLIIILRYLGPLLLPVFLVLFWAGLYYPYVGRIFSDFPPYLFLTLFIGFSVLMIFENISNKVFIKNRTAILS